MSKIIKENFECNHSDVIDTVFRHPDLMKDGRFMVIILELMLCDKKELKKAPNNTKGYDAIENNDDKSEIKTSLDNKKYNIGRSKSHGAGRKFNVEETIKDISNIHYYYFLNHTQEKVEFIKIPIFILINLLQSNQMKGTINHKTLIKKLKELNYIGN